jgi:hypothetical protein
MKEMQFLRRIVCLVSFNNVNNWVGPSTVLVLMVAAMI